MRSHEQLQAFLPVRDSAYPVSLDPAIKQILILLDNTF